MKLLFDQNVSFRITKNLSPKFQGSVHVSDVGLRDCKDLEIWQYAKAHSLTIVTFDSDFYDISIINGHPPKIVWIRTGNMSTQSIIELMNHQTVELIDFILNNKEDSCLVLE